MAEAKIYFKFEQGDWQGPYGDATSRGSDNNTAANHAERQAWRIAQKVLQAWYDQRKDNFANQRVSVKIWVDNIVCPQCQLWMIAGVLRNLGAFQFKPKLFVEVKSGGGTQLSGEVTRDYVWPVNLGHVGYETLNVLRTKVGINT